MPNLPDLPGKDLVAGTSKRARAIAVGAGAGVLAIGGIVARRVLGGHGGGDAEQREPPTVTGLNDGLGSEPVAAPPPPEPKPAKPKAPKPKLPESPRPKAERPTRPPKPKPAKPAKSKPAKAAKPKAPKPARPKTAKPARPKTEPGDQRGGKDPHHALNNPIDDPDPTEYPDPFDRREDPLDAPHPPTGAESTSEPPPGQDPEVGGRAKPPRRDNLDE